MKKIEFGVIGLSYSQDQMGSYILVLSQIDNDIIKLPIIIKQNEAQYIAFKLEGIKTNKPLIFDLFKSFTDTLGGDIQEIFIHTLVEGIFYCKIIVTNSIDEFEINCSVGDGIALSLAYNCPIFVSKEVIGIAGVEMQQDGTITDEQKNENHKERKSNISVDNLEKMLEKAIENEEYEIASQLRDRINQLKGDDISNKP